jgi:hypothetical protein
MWSCRVFGAAIAVAMLFAGTALVRADDKKDEKKGIDYDLAHYFPIRDHLAADDFTAKYYYCPMHPEVSQDQAGKCPKCEMPLSRQAVQHHAERLAKSECKAVAKAGEELTKAKDIESARKAFGDLSKALIDEIAAANEKGEKFRQVFVFECSMSKPYGKWVQDSKEIGNPYQGSRMLKCGKLVDTKGDEKCKDGCRNDEKRGDKKDDHKDQDQK